MIEFNKCVLKNGITILSEKRPQPLVTIFAALKQGASNELEKEKGISHFLEHMVFRGTKKRTSNEISQSIEKTGGLINGFTDEELTAFYVTIPSRYLELGVDILADITQNPKFSSEDIEKERKIISEEIRMQHDLPQIYIIKKLISLLYAPPFGTPMIGNFETISKINRQNLLNLHSKYMPKNLIISVVGNVSVEKIEELVNKKFIFKNKDIQTIKPKITRISAESIEKRPNLNQAHIALGFHMPSALEKIKYAAGIFDSILVQGMSSKLYQEVREKRGLVYHIDGMYESGRRYGMELIYAGTSADKIKLVKTLILKEINKMKNLNKLDFEEAKEKLIGGFELLREKSEQVAKDLIYDEIALGAEEYYNTVKKISEVKFPEVKQIAKTIKNFSSAFLLPK